MKEATCSECGAVFKPHHHFVRCDSPTCPMKDGNGTILERLIAMNQRRSNAVAEMNEIGTVQDRASWDRRKYDHERGIVGDRRAAAPASGTEHVEYDSAGYPHKVRPAPVPLDTPPAAATCDHGPGNSCEQCAGPEHDMLAQGEKMNDEQIKHMVNRFLMWRLPKNFNPDCGVSFTNPTRPYSDAPWWPFGTNLLDAQQAEAMVRYIIDGMPKADGWSDDALYQAYLMGCEDECLPEPLSPKAFREKFAPASAPPSPPSEGREQFEKAEEKE